MPDLTRKSSAQQEVSDHYGAVATRVATQTAADGSATGSTTDGASDGAFKFYAESEYASVPTKACSASRGCGNPLSQVNLQPGETVLDLGCGAGIDVLLAAAQVGAQGHIYGLDMTEQMLELARLNAQEADAQNVSFIHGFLENIPLPDGSVDVVTSNCVINLCDDKSIVLKEAFRVLKAQGRFIVADIVIDSSTIEHKQAQTLGVILGCTNGVLTKPEYTQLMQAAGFSQVQIEVYKTYPSDLIAQKAATREQIHLLDGFDPEQADHALGGAFISAVKGTPLPLGQP
ncbi:MAG: methyltransferase domain-containing protein [Coriobacteriales bacterium]|jgi:SAM-dependent methyltransferase|nr:methyltransferase domain-containing protein [Coriobacteriales bacterium]